jgi:transcription antitermination protein NusB
MKNRRKSRELALQTLYAWELGADDDSRRLLQTIAENNGFSLDVREYAGILVQKCIAALAEIDEALQRHAKNWSLKRMAAIDRNVLRLAVAELRFCPEVPFRVIIDEAVEIAKIYGTDDSGKFVNGIIDAIYHEISPKTGKEPPADGTDA